MIPGFVSYSYSVNKNYIGKKGEYKEKISPANIEDCYEMCKLNNCYCWERPEGGFSILFAVKVFKYFYVPLNSEKNIQQRLSSSQETDSCKNLKGSYIGSLVWHLTFVTFPVDVSRDELIKELAEMRSSINKTSRRKLIR